MTGLLKAKLLKKISSKWDELQAYLDGLSDEQRMQMDDLNGWTVKDHAIHLSLWEDNLLALLDGQSRAEYFGVTEATWKKGSDAINAILQPRHKDRSWPDVQQAMQDSHARVVARVESMTEEQLQLPYKHYQPSTRRNAPVVGWIDGNTWHHYAEHLEWMKAISAMTVADVVRQVERKWNEMWKYLGSLNDRQMTQLTDAGGWSVKDHAMHLSQWHETFPALLDGKSRAEALGVTQAMWEDASKTPRGWDDVNAVIQLRYRDLPASEVLRRLQDSHTGVLARIRAMSDADAMLPYRHFQPSSTIVKPIVHWMRINTFEHYDEHLGWMKGILEAAK